MARRYIGDAVVNIKYRDRGDYAGTVSAGGHTWRFEDLHAPAGGLPYAYDSPQAYDKMAESAVGFASYYTSYNRGEDTPEWAPSAETADAIAEASQWAQDDRGEYEVRRSKSASANSIGDFESNPSYTSIGWIAAYVVIGGIIYYYWYKSKKDKEAATPSSSSSLYGLDPAGFLL
jgi:hypothetical protein